MTNEKAIETIKHGCIYRDKRGGEALEVAVEAIQKQIPKKVSVLEMPSESIYSCPNCHTVFPNEHSAIPRRKYCSNCGQALDFNSNGSDIK